MAKYTYFTIFSDSHSCLQSLHSMDIDHPSCVYSLPSMNIDYPSCLHRLVMKQVSIVSV